MLSPISISSASTIHRVSIHSPPELRSPIELPITATRPKKASSYSTADATVGTVPTLSKPSLGRPSTTTKESEMSGEAKKRRKDGWELSSDDDADAVVDAVEGLTPFVELGKVVKVKSKSAKRTTAKGKTKEAGKQSKIEGAKVTKSRASAGKADAKKSKDALKKQKQTADEPLGLDKVAPRRRDWTPVKSRQTSGLLPAPTTVEGAADDCGEAAGEGSRPTSQGSLQRLLGAYGYDASLKQPVYKKPPTSLESVPPLKKRKLNLVESAAPTKPVATVTKKERARKKKARTITELTTSEFRPVDDVLRGSTSLMDCFVGQQSKKEEALDSDAEAEAMDKNRKAVKLIRSKAVVKTKSRLLSPERAIEAVECQELLFGTSSQLVRDDSPSFIRDLQHALKESEASASQQATDQGLSQPQPVVKGLWSAAIRNTDGSLLEAETVDLTRSTRANFRRTSNIGAFQATPSLQAPSRPSLVAASSIMNEDSPHFRPRASPEPTVPPLGDDADLEDPSIVLPKSIAEAACKSRPRSKSPTKRSRAPKSKDGTATSSTTRTKKAKDKADFNKWTVVELAKQIKNYGFKPVKGKAAMVALLEKCKQSQEATIASAVPEREVLKPLNVNGSVVGGSEEKSPHFEVVDKATASKTKSKAKTRARTKDTTKEGNAIVNEDDAPTPVPKKRGRPRKVTNPSTVPASPATASKPTPAEPSASTSASTTARRTTAPDPEANAELLTAITQAITTFPPSADPKHFTWHEKILMYDPIVLEDLTVWLNTEGLGRVNVDEEVWPALVREWCESRSVCCLWRESTKGGSRKRY